MVIAISVFLVSHSPLVVWMSICSDSGLYGRHLAWRSLILCRGRSEWAGPVQIAPLASCSEQKSGKVLGLLPHSRLVYARFRHQSHSSCPILDPPIGTLNSVVLM